MWVNRGFKNTWGPNSAVVRTWPEKTLQKRQRPEGKIGVRWWRGEQTFQAEGMACPKTRIKKEWL